MQSKKELEQWYQTADPWGYRDNEHDKERKSFILAHLTKKYKRALDIGCGEGFITEALPAQEIYGIELSDTASSRLPKNVKRVQEPNGKYDLVIATGILYKHYDWKQVVEWIKQSASKTILLCNITDWEIEHDFGRPVYETWFKYRTFIEHLVIYDVSRPQHSNSKN